MKYVLILALIAVIFAANVKRPMIVHRDNAIDIKKYIKCALKSESLREILPEVIELAKAKEFKKILKLVISVAPDAITEIKECVAETPNKIKAISRYIIPGSQGVKGPFDVKLDFDKWSDLRDCLKRSKGSIFYNESKDIRDLIEYIWDGDKKKMLSTFQRLDDADNDMFNACK